MSSVLHPVGPEPRERYWVRRVAVLVAAVVAIGIVIALVGNAMSAGSAVQAEPAPPAVPPVQTVPAATPSGSPTPATTPTANPTGNPTATPGGTPAATPTAGSPSETATPSGSATASDKKASSQTASEDAGKKTTSTTKKKVTGKKKVTEQPVYPACDASKLRPTLTGDRSVKAGKKTTLSLSLINGGKKTCTARVSTSDATLTVVSGSDRIWSTKDCPKALPATKRTLLPEHALTWKVTWSGTRSGDGCSTAKPAPKKGYYWAIASFDGADDVRFRIILT